MEILHIKSCGLQIHYTYPEQSGVCNRYLVLQQVLQQVSLFYNKIVVPNSFVFSACVLLHPTSPTPVPSTHTFFYEVMIKIYFIWIVAIRGSQNNTFPILSKLKRLSTLDILRATKTKNKTIKEGRVSFPPILAPSHPLQRQQLFSAVTRFVHKHT